MRPVCCGLVAAVVAGPASAQVAATGAGVSGAGPPVLEEIVVAARRRDENLQDTPVSVTVFGAGDLERRSLTKLEDLTEFVPSLRRSAGPQGGSSGHYFARGVGQLDFIASTDPGVGVYLDGVYLGRTTGAAFDLLDVQRVEVLRGPQGALFGRNTIGGAINVVSAPPPAEPRGGASLIVGARQRREARVDVGGPLGVRPVLASVAVLARSSEGWQRRLTDGGRFGDERTYAARGALEWGTAALTLRAVVDATRSRGTADPHYLAAANAALGGHPEYVVTDPATTWSGQAGRDDLDARGASVTLTYELPRMTLKSITAVRELDSTTGIDFDGTPRRDLDQLVATEQTQVSEEVQLAGSARGGRLTWLAGAFLFGEDVQQGVPIVFFDQPLSQNNSLDNRALALFAHVAHAVNDRISLSGGLRSAVETKTHVFDHYFVSSTGNTPLFPVTELEDRWRSLTPKVGVEVRVRGDLLFYGALSQGFRSGGFNGRPFGIDEFLAYDPETLTTLETGIKSEWLERRLRFNAALFTSDYDDIQLSRTATSSSGTPIVVTGNAGEAEIQGFELELTAAVSPRWLVAASIGRLQNQYARVEPGAAVDFTSKLPVSPAWTVSASAEYATTFASGTLRARIDWSYTSRYNYFFDNPPLGWEEARRLVNARVSFAPGENLELAAFVLNATDERYSVFREDVRTTFGVAIVWPAQPRAWGLEARYRF